MGKIYTAPFAQTTKTAHAVVTSACANIHTAAPSNLVEIYRSGVEGALITSLTAMANGDVAATGLFLFLKPSGSSETRLKDSVGMAAGTRTVGGPITKVKFEDVNENTPIRLGGGDVLYVGSDVANAQGITLSLEATEF